MKKILLLLFGLFISTYCFSQEKYSDYTLDYFSRTYDIEIGKPDNKGIFSTYIEIQCSDDNDREVNILLYSDKIDAFKESIEQAKAKYIEWRQVAIDNKVDKISKRIDVKFPSVGGVFSYGEWRFDFYVTLTSRFIVLDGDKYLMIIDTDEIVASDNQYIKTEGYIVFSSVEEIDLFLNKIDFVKMQEFTNKKSSTESLFK